jgi:hypothetical protein
MNMGAERDGARAPEEIVEEIVVNVRPWSQAEAAVHKGVVNQLSWLLMVRNEMLRNKKSCRRTESNQAVRKLEPALRALINVMESVPPDFFGSRQCSELLRHLQILSANLERRKQLRKFIPKKYDLMKMWCAISAYEIIERLSDRPPTGTVEGPLRTVASLLYEAATGKPEVDLKRACDAKLKQMREYDRYDLIKF